MFKILGIHGAYNVAHTINYIGDSASPAHTTTTSTGHLKAVPKGTPNAKRVGRSWYLPNQDGIYHRNLVHWGINMVATNTKEADRDANAIIKQRPHKLRGLQLIISPQKKLDPHDPDKIYRFQQFTTGVVKELYGPNYASYCAIQSDNGHTHVHVITPNTNMRTHQSLRGKTYSVQHINKIIDHQIDLDNKRYPNDPIFTKHNIATNKLESLRTTLTDNDNTKLINKAVNTVLKPGYTVTNRQGKKRIIASNNMFKYAMKQQGVEPYFKRHKKYYHNRHGDRIPVTNHGKTERTKRGAIKYKYYLRHGLVYRIRSKHKHNVKLNASDVAKLYPNCSYNYIHDALHKNYVRYVNSHQHDRNAKIQHDVKQMQRYRQHSAEYQRVHVYRPNDVRDVMPNLRNPIKHELYNDLNEIEPVMAVHKKQGQHLKRTQHLYMTQPNQMERGMIQHYRTNLFSRLHRKYDKIKKRTLMYKTKIVNSFKNEANKAGDWLQHHHLRNVGKWVKKVVQKKNKKKKIHVFSKRPVTVSNQLANQTGNPYSKNVELAKKIEANNHRILDKPIVHENDINNKPISIDDVFNGLHSTKAKRAFYIHLHELVPMILTPKYHKLGLYGDKLLNHAGSFAGNDQYLTNDYFYTLYSRIDKGIKITNNPVFNKYPNNYQQLIILQQLVNSDLKEARPILNEIKPVIKTPLGTHSNISDMTLTKYLLLYGRREGSTKLYDNNGLYLQHESDNADSMGGSILIHGKPILRTYHDDLNNYRKAKLQKTIRQNEINRRHENYIRRQQPRPRPHRPHFNDDGPTLG